MRIPILARALVFWALFALSVAAASDQASTRGDWIGGGLYALVAVVLTVRWIDQRRKARPSRPELPPIIGEP